jgi:hypothetical protein
MCGGGHFGWKRCGKKEHEKEDMTNQLGKFSTDSHPLRIGEGVVK